MIPDRPIDNPAAWRGDELSGRDDWVYRLSGAQVAELEDALAVAKQTGKEATALVAADFPLPGLGPVLESWLRELEEGRGFWLIRGVPVAGKTAEECALMYCGIGSHLGTTSSQNAAGDLLGHVRDTGADPDDPSVRLYKTKLAQPFHTDGADIIGLLCLRGARRGGRSLIASSVTVFNEVLDRRPDLAPLMFDSFPFDRNEEQAEGEDPYFNFPLCAFDGTHLRTFYVGWYIRDSQRHAAAPRLSQSQRELLDLIDETAARPDIHLAMDFQPGDIQLLKNSVILHSRTEYEDHAEPDRKRHLLRLWLTAHREMRGGDSLLQGGIPKKEGVASDAST